MAIRSTPSSASRFDWMQCSSCRLIRRFLFVAVLLLVALWSQPAWELPRGYNYSAIVGDLFLALFVGLLGWKVYQHVQERRAGLHDDGLTWLGHSRHPARRQYALTLEASLSNEAELLAPEVEAPRAEA